MAETRFTFSLSPFRDPLPIAELSCALDRRQELYSRKRLPFLWSLVDRLNASSRNSVGKGRKILRTALSLVNYFLGMVLIVPAFTDLKGLLPLLLIGAASLLLGHLILWHLHRRLLGFLDLGFGLVLSIAAQGADALHALMPAGFVLLVVGLAALLAKPRSRETRFAAAAKQLITQRDEVAAKQPLRVTFTEDAMISAACKKDGTLTEETAIPYSEIDCCFETPRLLLPVFQNSILLLQKQELSGSSAKFRSFLEKKVSIETVELSEKSLQK